MERTRVRMYRRVTAVAVLILLGAAVGVPGVNAEAGFSTDSVLQAELGQSTLVQDPTFLALKDSGRVGRGSTGEAQITASAPEVALSAYQLDYTVTGVVVEPQGNQYDDLHHAINDKNYWNFCPAGAADAALYYWKPTNVTGWSAGYFTEPYGPHKSTTYWRSSDTGTASDTSNGYATKGRAYLMYLAEKVKPPSYSRPGIIDFDNYPTSGGSITDVRDAVNWEASGHGSNWQNYFYVYVPTSGLTQSTLHTDVTADVSPTVKAAVVVTVYTYWSSSLHLPNWSRNVAHAITIIGWDDSHGTYTYLDTCGKVCNGSSSATNGGVHVVSQGTMYQLIMKLGGGFIW